MKIRTENLRGVTVARLGRMASMLNLNPPYQREGGIWNESNQRLLIDSLINGLDIPKLYFEAAPAAVGSDRTPYHYAVIDGKQRLEAILAFLGERLALPSTFVFFEEESREAQGSDLSGLYDRHPNLAQRFLNYELPIVVIHTDSGDLIEEMFQRLNAASDLNAAEHRNSISGATHVAANLLAEHPFLVSKSPIKNARYKYRELAAKFLAVEHQMTQQGRVVDTKARTLSDLFLATHKRPPSIVPELMESYQAQASEGLNKMAMVFRDEDYLLKSIGTVVVYYVAFRDQRFAGKVDRDMLASFEVSRRTLLGTDENSTDDDRPANRWLRLYNTRVQSTNDGRAITERVAILTRYVLNYDADDPLASLDTLTMANDAPD